MSQSDVEKAITFIQGIATRDPALATRHLSPAGYLEHAPYVAGGADGMRAYVDGLPQMGLPLDVVRTFGDGAHVVVQSHGEVRGRHEFFDVFRFEDGLIVEHWSFGAPGGPPNRSGHTQVDGPTEPASLEATERNKATVREYYETVHIGGNHDRIRRYMSGETQIRHEPGVEDGVTAFERDLAVITRNRTIDEIGLLLGRGDFVFLVARGTHEGRPCLYVDLYRVEAGKLVEHRGFPEAVPPKEERINRNGML